MADFISTKAYINSGFSLWDQHASHYGGARGSKIVFPLIDMPIMCKSPWFKWMPEMVKVRVYGAEINILRPDEWQIKAYIRDSDEEEINKPTFFEYHGTYNPHERIGAGIVVFPWLRVNAFSFFEEIEKNYSRSLKSYGDDYLEFEKSALKFCFCSLSWLSNRSVSESKKVVDTIAAFALEVGSRCQTNRVHFLTDMILNKTK